MNGILKKFMPTREELTPKDYTIVADLDAFIEEPVAFKFGGKMYEILPVDTKAFMKVSRELDRIRKFLESRAEGKDITDEQIADSYFSFFSPLCPELKRDDVGKMTVAQLHALLQLFIRHLTGQELDPVKKKHQMIKPTPTPTQGHTVRIAP